MFVSMVAASTGGDKDEVTRHLFQTLSVQLVRGDDVILLYKSAFIFSLMKSIKPFQRL